jgi:hypothetical protein
MCCPPLSLRMETDPVSEAVCSLGYRKTNKVKRPHNPEKKQYFQDVTPYDLADVY